LLLSLSPYSLSLSLPDSLCQGCFVCEHMRVYFTLCVCVCVFSRHLAPRDSVSIHHTLPLSVLQ
jgi:VanZ family protein